MLVSLFVVLIFMLAVMTVAWLTVLRTRNAGWIDVFWTFGTGAAGVIAALSPWAGVVSARQILAAALVAAWALRLGGYIILRVARSEEDVRYRDLRAEWGADFDRKVFSLIIVQAPATALLCLSILVAALRPGPLGATDLVAGLILIIAVAGEGLADRQMKRFKADPTNRGKVMDQGLWGLSRHPNYVFEWLVWTAWPVMAVDLSGRWPLGWMSLIAPIVMYLILTRMTGVPPLERAMLKSKGAAYADYQRRVGAFFPRLTRRSDA